LSDTSEKDAALIAKIFGIEEGTFNGRELRIR
jgi:hypothetical protein